MSFREQLKPWVRRLAPLAMPLFYAAFTLLIYWKLWTPIEDARGFWRFDPRNIYWGDLVFQHQSGIFSLWNPFDRAGFPTYADPQPGMLYPLNWPFALWGDLAGSLPPWSISVKILGHWIFGAVGMHLLMRRLGSSEQSAYLGGMLFSFTSPKLRYGGSTINWSVAWLPWVLLALHWFCEKPSVRRAIVLGSSVAMILLSGAPTVVLYCTLIAVPLGIYWLRGRLKSSLPQLAIAAGVSLLWVLPVVLSNAELLPLTVRQSRDFAFIADSGFTPGHLLSFAVPRLGGENPYVGFMPLVAIGLAVALTGRKRAFVLLGVGGLGIALAFGWHSGFMPAAASALPPFTFFRRAHRYLYLTSLAIAVLAALGLSGALSLSCPDRKKALARAVTWVGAMATFALGIAYLVSVVMSDKLATAKNAGFGLAVLSAGVGTWLLRSVVYYEGRRQQAYAWIIVAVVALDLWTANSKVVEVGLTPPPVMAHDQKLAELGDIKLNWRIYDRQYLKFRPGTRHGVRDFGGYEDDPLALSRYVELLEASKKRPTLLGHANVRYLLEGSSVRDPLRKRGFSKVRGGIYELPDVAPSVMYVPRPEVVQTQDEALAALRKLVPGHGAVVEGPAPPAAPTQANITAGVITELEPHRVVAEIDTPGPGLIVVAEAFYPAWRATVNGQPVTMQPANLAFRGIPVASGGHHVIEMTLRPARFWWTLPTYAIGFLLLILAALPHGLVRRLRGAKPAEIQNRES